MFEKTKNLKWCKYEYNHRNMFDNQKVENLKKNFGFYKMGKSILGADDEKVLYWCFLFAY